MKGKGNGHTLANHIEDATRNRKYATQNEKYATGKKN